MTENIFIKNLPTLDLHGTTYDIAVVMTNDFIEENVILKQHKIVIIHGIGKGIVKNAMTKVLKENKNVIDYKVDIFNPGCTIVELRVL